MSRLSWDAVGDRRFEIGVDRGVLYPKSGPGVPWSGLINVTKGGSGGDIREYHLDGIKYYQDSGNEDLTVNIKAFTYPDEFEPCQGNGLTENGLAFGLQGRQQFGFSYRTRLGDDVLSTDLGYKIHLVYNCLATPTTTSYDTMSDSLTPTDFTWDVSTVPVNIPGRKPTADIFIDSTNTNRLILSEVEDILYGTETTEPRLPTPTELVTLFGTGLFRTNENVVSGLGLLSRTAPFDLKGHINDGVYEATKNTRLKETNTPGLYDLE